MKYSNHLEVDVVSHLWAAILKNSQYSRQLYNLALIWLDLYALKLGIGQTEQTEIWVLARPNRPKYGYWPDRNLGIGQTEQAEIWVSARSNRPKYGYWPDRTDRNTGIGQTEQTEIWVFARTNRLKVPLARRKARPKFFPDHCGRSHRTPQSATQVGLANTCLGSRTSSWDWLLIFCLFFCWML